MFGDTMFQMGGGRGGNTPTPNPTPPTKGDTGKSAYEHAVENGFVGSLDAWLDSLKGGKGERGEDGVTPTAEQIAEQVAQQMPTREALGELIAQQIPTESQFRALIAPLVPPPLKGEDGHSPTAQELRELIIPLIPTPIPGPPGPKGDSGPKPTREELVELITPLIPAPVPGPAGGNGASAYQLAVANGFVGSVSEWLESLRVQGPKGDTGSTGSKGDKGDTGDIGAIGPRGETGSQGLKGDAGSQGLKGDTGSQGLKGDTGPSGKVALGTFTVRQTGTASAGVRHIAFTAATAGLTPTDIATLQKVVAGDDLLAFPISTMPNGYAIHNIVATGNGTMTVTITGPSLGTGVSFTIPVRLVALR